MKEKIKITILAAAVAMSALTVGICALAETDGAVPKEVSSGEGASSKSSVYYILKEYEGRLAVFISDDVLSPIEVLEVYISDLPERDAEKLREGITAPTMEKIMQMAEDYE